MSIKSGFIAGPMSNTSIERKLFEVGNNVMKGVLKKFSRRAYADEVGEDDGDDEGKTPPSVNIEDLMAKARKEEKDKQYKTIEKLKSTINTLTEQHNTDLLAKAELEKKLKEAEAKLVTAGTNDPEEIKNLKNSVTTLTEEKKKLEAKIETFEKNKPASREEIEAEVRAELEAEYTVKSYKAEKMAELKDQILVPELVMGSTKEEIDASLDLALTRSKEIRKSLGISEGATTTPAKRTPRGGNPDTSNTHMGNYSYEHLAGLDPASDEYKKIRKELGLK